MTGKSDGDKVFDLGRKKMKEKKETKVSSYTTRQFATPNSYYS